MTAKMTGKDNNNSKDDDSKDNGNNGKDDYNDGGNDDSGEVGGVARSVAWLVAVFFAIGCLALTYRRNCADTFGNKFILV